MQLKPFTKKSNEENGTPKSNTGTAGDSLCVQDSGETLTTQEPSFTKQLLWYTLLFIITALGVYLCFLYFGRTFLRASGGNFDGIAQVYPSYASIKDYLSALFSGEGPGFWSWALGLGDDYFELLKSKLVNPLTWLIVAAPDEYLDVSYDVVTLFRQYLAGVTFMFFAREVSMNSLQKIAGALGYTFSGWMIASACAQGSFLNAAVVLPLLIMGAERILKGKSPILFVVSIFLFFLSGVIWTYVGGITAIFYFVFRYFYYNKGKGPGAFLKAFLYYCICGICGILISSLFAISMVLSVTGTTTAAAYEAYTLHYSLMSYLKWILSFTAITRTSTLYSYLYTPVLCMMVLPLALGNIRKKRSTPALLALLLFLASFLPITGKIFNGFSYTVGRWFFVLVFFMVWAAAEVLGQKEFLSKKGLKIMALWLALLGIWNIGVCYFGLKITDLNDACATAFTLFFGYLILLALYLWNYTDFLKGLPQIHRRRLLPLVILLLMMISVMSAENFNVFTYFTNHLYGYAKVGNMKKNLDQSTQRVAQDLQQEDSSFFRTDQVDGNNDTRLARVQANENLYFGNRSVYMYFSTISKDWLAFNKAMGNNAGYFDRTTSFSNDNRAALDLLMGVKYFLGDSDTKRDGASEYAPYGFSYAKTIDGVDILQNKYYIGLGTALRGYITESELMEFPALVRDQVLLQAAVIPDEEAASIQGVHHFSRDEIQAEINTLHYKITEQENLSIREDGMSVTSSKGGSFTIDIPESAATKNCQLMVSFQGLSRKTNSYLEYRALSGHSPELKSMKAKIRALSYVDDEEFAIGVTKDKVEKNALYRKGKNQALMDIEDFNINLGYYDDASGTIEVTINNGGEYTFDDLEVYAIPMDVYDESAPALEESRYNVTEFSNDHVSGTVSAKEDSILYLSILENDGWTVTVDGKKAQKIEDTNLAFTGVAISSGNHTVELNYTPVYLKPAALLTIIGILAIIVVEVTRRKRTQSSGQPTNVTAEE